MYSYDDRMRAVKLYMKLGKRMAATLRSLGFGNKNSLKAWCRKFEERQALPMGYVRKKPRFSVTMKKTAVEHFLDHGRSITFTQKALGYPCRDTLRKWIEEMHPEAKIRVLGRAQPRAQPQTVKKVAVVELCTRQGSARAIAEKLAVSRPILYNWKNQLLGRRAPASMKHEPNASPSSDRSELEKTVEALKRDIHKLQLEHDLLKKATELLKKRPRRRPSTPEQSGRSAAG